MSSLPPDPYKALGIAKDAAAAEVRAAYKKLALRCHPDKVQDPELKTQKQDEFQKVQQAYELLNSEDERRKYDDKVKLLDLRAQAQKFMQEQMKEKHSPRTPRAQYTFVNIIPAEPRGSSSPRYPPPPPLQKVYQHHGPSRSYDENVHKTSRAVFEETGPRRTESFEHDKPSKRDDERRERSSRRSGRDRERDRERDADYDRQKRQEDKRREEKDREDRKKKADKERKRDTEEKSRRKSPYVEPYEGQGEEVYPSAKPEKKKQTSKKHDSPREKSKGRDASPKREPDKLADTIDTAYDYMLKKRGGKPPPPLPIRSGPTRSQTFQEPPTYTVPPLAVPSPPPPSRDFPDEDIAYRSSARRRASHDVPLRSREAPRRGSSGDPIVVDAVAPGGRKVPPLQTSYSSPPVVPDSPPRPHHLPRANTTQEYSRPVPHPQPQIRRAFTFATAEEPDQPRSRRGSHQHQPYYEEDSEDDRRHRRSRRTQSPEPLDRYTSTKYSVNNGKTSRRDFQPDSESPTGRKSQNTYSGSAYPKVDYARDAAYGGGYGGSNFKFKVKESRAYTHDDVQYSDMPHTAAPRDQAFVYG